jgi:hypothetical protein
MLEENRRRLNCGGEIRPACWLVSGEGKGKLLAVPISGDERTKDDEYRGVAAAARKFEALAVVMTADVWVGAPTIVHVSPGEDLRDHVPAYLLRPSVDPDRREALTATVVLPDGSVALHLQQLYRSRGGMTSWETCQEIYVGGQYLIPAWQDGSSTADTIQ